MDSTPHYAKKKKIYYRCILTYGARTGISAKPEIRFLRSLEGKTRRNDKKRKSERKLQ
jgi:hypothetical protein